MVHRLVRALPLGFFVATAAASAQTNNPAGPPVSKSDYALTNVRIVTAPGKVIERGTVVFVDGRITAVGANVAIPAGVVRMDLAGHTVFAGLIDAATSVGLPNPMRPLPTMADATAAPAGRGGGRGGAGGRPAAGTRWFAARGASRAPRGRGGRRGGRHVPTE